MILGFQGTSIINYPGHISSVIFLSDCNFHCPYCYNKSLVFPDREIKPLSKEYCLDQLEERKDFITGVCITGGEPTLYHFDLIKMLEEIRERVPNIKIKLDTNGSRPDVLKNVFDSKLINYVAMDYKTDPNNYKDSISKFDVSDVIIESIKLIRESFKSGNYEFRTTVLREMFDSKIAKRMAKHLTKEDTLYLQSFKFIDEESHINIKAFKNIKTLSYNKKEIIEEAAPLFKTCNVVLRGFD